MHIATIIAIARLADRPRHCPFLLFHHARRRQRVTDLGVLSFVHAGTVTP